MKHRRQRLRTAVLRLLDGMPTAPEGAAATLPFVAVSTPEETPAEDGGYVAGPTDLEILLEIQAFAATEDGVDELLAEVEARLAVDPSLGGLAANPPDYRGHTLDADEEAYIGASTWAVRTTTEEV